MSEFSGKQVRPAGGGEVYDAVDFDSELYGPSVVLTDTAGELVLVYRLDAFRADGLYEIVEPEG